MFVTSYPLSSKYVWSTPPLACWNHTNSLSEQFWPLVTSVSFICCTKQLSLVLGMFCVAQVRNSFWLLSAMHGLSYSRSDKVICCSFLTLDAMKFVHCVNRLERPFPLGYFEYHHSPLCFSAAKCISLHHGNGSVSAETFLPFCCCVIKCLHTNILDCSYFQCFSYLLFPQLWQTLGQAIMLWSCFLFTESLLDLSVTSFRLILGKESHGLSSESCLHWYFFKSHGEKRLVLQRAAWRHASVEVHSCCQACSSVQGGIGESTCEPIVHEPSEAVPAASGTC